MIDTLCNLYRKHGIEILIVNDQTKQWSSRHSDLIQRKKNVR